MKIIKKMKLFSLVAFAALILGACTVVVPVNSTENPVGNKVGFSSCSTFLFLWLGDADCSIKEAAKNGGITKIATVQYKVSTILGIFNTYHTIVTGE